MKKYLALVVALCALAVPSRAALNVLRDANGQIVLEATDCSSIARMMDILDLPDDPPGTADVPDDPPGGETPDAAADEDPADDPAPSPARKKINPDVVQGATTVINALVSDDQEPTRKDSHGLSQEVEDLLDAASFEERQDSFITFVRDVNWKTGMHITFRDFNFFRRLKMACSGLNQMTKPLRMNLGIYTEDLDQTIDKAADAGIDRLAQAARGHSFTAMSKLSVVGLSVAIEKENPFLLLALDEETYKKLVEFEPKIAELFEDMYMFFKIRSVRMGDYHSNIKELIRVSNIGKGDAFNTWHVMSEYAKKMLELERKGQLEVTDERDIHIWRLESSMRYVQEHVRIEKRAAELAAQDPKNAKVLRELSTETKKKPSLDDKARELLSKSTEAEIKKLIRKYVTK